MLADVVRTMYDYNAWANRRLFDTAARLTPEQFTSACIAGQDPVRDTLIHLVDTQGAWLTRFRGQGGYTDLDPRDCPEVAGIRRRWEEIERETRDFLAQQDEASLTRDFVLPRPGRDTRVDPLWQLMLHVVNHGTQHRSEVAAMLTACGHSPGDLDLSYFLDEAKGRR
ncbi:MAG TPA: DinB family protein [Thermomicrobiales bacterium]|nr:DinB family protein [Thermomicrobiales bacterium]